MYFRVQSKILRKLKKIKEAEMSRLNLKFHTFNIKLSRKKLNLTINIIDLIRFYRIFNVYS